MKFVQIIADDLGYGDLPSYGNAEVIAPNLAAFAAAGRQYQRFYVASPVCSTSRTAEIMGMMPQFFHVHAADVPEVSRRYFLPCGANTIAKRLKRAGYATAHFGKWHLGEPPLTKLPRRMGFDRFFGTVGGRPSSSWIAYARYENAQWVDDEPPVSTIAGYATTVMFDKAMEWITQHAHENFYCQIWTHFPHEPLDLSIPEAALYPGKTDPQKAYWGSITAGDTKIGQLMALLVSLGIDDETYMLLSSDNGPEIPSTGPLSAGSTGGLRGWKTHLWEGGIRVPLLFRGPGIAAGSVDTEPRWALDYVPTILALAGIPVPSFLTGKSLLQNGIPERALTWEYHGSMRPTDPSPQNAIRKGKWKLLDVATPQLYDLDVDPAETTNVAAGNPAKRDELVADLTAFLATLPAETSSGSPVTTPPTESEANAVAAEPICFTRYARPGTGGDMTTLIAELNLLLGLAREVPCTHTRRNMREDEYGNNTVAHPTLSGTSIIFDDGIEAALDVTANRNRCTAPQLADLDDRIREGFGHPRA